MIYREYGNTGEKVSLLGFGGMRFKIIDHDASIILMVDAASKYFGDRSETVMGEAFDELRRLHFPFYCSTKTTESDEKSIRKEIKARLEHL